MTTTFSDWNLLPPGSEICIPLPAAASSTAPLIPRRGCANPPPRSKINTFFSLVCTEIYRVSVSHRVTVLKLTPSDVGKPLSPPVIPL
ncbi:hypothetical protein U1Q18_024526 [Sarracenia purpurea var. burkii]